MNTDEQGWGKKFPVLVKLYLCSSVFICGSSVLAVPPVVPETAPLEIKVPDFKTGELSCGMRVLLLKSDEMPLVEARFLAPGGQAADPQGKEGLAGLTNSCLRNGGAGKLDPEAFDEALDNKAASMGASADQESFAAQFKCLSEDLPEILALFADMLRRPRFETARFEAAKANQIDALERLRDTPDALTRVLFYKGLMAGSPYGRWASPKSLGSVSRADIVRFHQRHYGPEGALISVTGKFDEAKLLSRLEGLFADWKKQGPEPAYADARPLGPAVYFFPKDVTQVFVRFGLLGIKRHDPEQIPLQVANDILGGSGFTSRLMKEIRSDRGLAYFVQSYFLPFDARGPFQVVGGTRPDSAKEYLSVLFHLMEEFAKKGPTETELAEAKQSMIEEFAYHFESPFTVSAYKASLDFNGYPEDYLATYRKKVKSVTRAQATKAMRSILSQENWVLAVCGPEALEKELSSFGRVVKVTDIFQPLPAKP
jgi:zinc protease